MALSKSSPATKKDLHDLETRLTKQIGASEGRMGKQMAKLEERMLQEFQLSIEIIRDDLKGANKDEIEIIKDDIVRLKQHTGLMPA
jgi:hypothetical protein